MVYQHYHFVGIGGIGMGALASLLLDQGRQVSGSDLAENYVIKQLKEKGARIFIGHNRQNIKGTDVVIFSSAIDPKNSELAEAKKDRIPIFPRAELLADLMKGHIGVTIAGAHGKTTTTSMVSHLLMKAGLEPTIAIGGIVQGTGSHACLGKGNYFVAEVDESDGSFLKFSPVYSIITNMDFEHVDYYHNWENILKAYREFMAKTAEDGCIFACGEDERLLKLLKESKKKFRTYGLSSKFDVSASNIQLSEGSAFDCVIDGQKQGTVSLIIPGEHNVLNALACVSLGFELSIDFKTIRDSLKEFQGVKRRLQLKGEIDGIKVMDDYAHHPTEIEMTLKAAQFLKKNRLIVVFQPHRFTRIKFLEKEFAQSLKFCDHLIVTDIYAASEKPIAGIDAQRLVEQIKKISSVPVVYLKRSEIVSHILETARPGDLVLTMGAGDITYVADDLLHAYVAK